MRLSVVCGAGFKSYQPVFQLILRYSHLLKVDGFSSNRINRGWYWGISRNSRNSYHYLPTSKTRTQAKQERLKWLRDKRVESYSNTIRYLTKALNKRSSISIESGTLVTIMGQDVVKEWFDDLGEALVWLSSLSIYCSENQQQEVINAFRVVEQAVSDLITSDSRLLNLQSVILSVLDSVIECARRDVGRAVK